MWQEALTKIFQNITMELSLNYFLLPKYRPRPASKSIFRFLDVLTNHHMMARHRSPKIRKRLRRFKALLDTGILSIRMTEYLRNLVSNYLPNLPQPSYAQSGSKTPVCTNSGHTR